MYAYMSGIGSLCGFCFGAMIGPVYMKNQNDFARVAIDLIYPVAFGFIGAVISTMGTKIFIEEEKAKHKNAHKNTDFKYLAGTSLAYFTYVLTYGERTQPLIVGAIALGTFVIGAVGERTARIEESISK